jgi:MFS family permease
MTVAEKSTRPSMSTFRQILLSFYWFSTNLMWAAILMITMPSQIKSAVGDASKGSALGLALGVGAFISMLAAPIFGALSDRIRLPGGRRKPWIVIGTLGTAGSLLGLAYLIQPGHPESLIGWSIAFIFWEFFSNIATAPYSALIPDLVSVEQRGSASGWLGLMTMLGTFAGGVTGFLVDPLGIASIYYLIIAAILLGLAVTVFGVDESDAPREIPPFKQIGRAHV